MIHRPWASMRRAPCGIAIVLAGPTARMRPSAMTLVWSRATAAEGSRSGLTTVAPSIAVTAGPEATPQAWGKAGAARRPDKARWAHAARITAGVARSNDTISP